MMLLKSRLKKLIPNRQNLSSIIKRVPHNLRALKTNYMKKSKYLNLYKVLQIKLLLYRIPIAIFLWIGNIFLYNTALCDNVPDTVTEWVEKYDTKDPSIWERLTRIYVDLMCILEDQPYTEEPPYKEPLVDDNNTTCESAVRDQPDSLRESKHPTSPLSEPLVNEETLLADLREKYKNLKYDNDSPIITEEWLESRLVTLNEVVVSVFDILQNNFPESTGDDMQYTDVKKAVFQALQNTNVSEWAANSELEIIDPQHEVNLRIGVIRMIIINNDDKLNPLEKEILIHIVTSMQTISAVRTLQISPELVESFVEANEATYTEGYIKFVESLSNE